MIKTTTWGLTATAAAALMLSMNAFAQTAPPATPPATTPAPAATTPAPAKKGVMEKAKDAVKSAKEAVSKKVEDTKKAASACKGLDQAGCAGKGAECAWIVPTKVNAKTGKADAAYCRKVAGVAKKAADKKAEAAKAAAPATAPAAPKPGATTMPAPAAPKKP